MEDVPCIWNYEWFQGYFKEERDKNIPEKVVSDEDEENNLT